MAVTNSAAPVTRAAEPAAPVNCSSGLGSRRSAAARYRRSRLTADEPTFTVHDRVLAPSRPFDSRWGRRATYEQLTVSLCYEASCCVEARYAPHYIEHYLAIIALVTPGWLYEGGPELSALYVPGREFELGRHKNDVAMPPPSPEPDVRDILPKMPDW